MDKKNSTERTTTILGILFTLLLLMSLTTSFFGLVHIENKATSLWISRIDFWVISFLIYLFAKKVEKTNFLKWKEQKQSVAFYIVSTAVTIGFIFLFLATISIIQRSFGHNVNNEVLNKAQKIWDNNLGLFIFTAFTAGVTEELIFRGYMLPRIEELTNNKWIAISISSLFFGLAHYTYNDMTRMVFPFIIGIVFSIHYTKYRSLISLIICHIFIDLLLV